MSAADAPLPDYCKKLFDSHSWHAKPLPDDHPVRWEYLPDDWRWVAANWVLEKLQEHDMLNSHYRKQLKSKRRGKIVSQWADEIRKLVELDGYTRDDIRITLGWLFTTDNWWRKNRTIQSLGAIRKKSDDGSTKFDKIFQSALADYEQQQEQRVDPEAIREGFASDDEDAAEPPGDALPSEPAVERNGFTW